MRESTPRQREIVEAARTIIFRDGIENLTVRRIADELKITDGALYRHFKSKEEILILLIDDIKKTLITTIVDASQKTEDPIKKLKNVFSAHLHYAEKRKGITFILMAHLKDKRLQKEMLSIINHYLKVIKNILKEGADRGRFKADINFESASIAFLGMVQGIVTIWGLSRYRYVIKKDRVDGMFELYKKGIMK